MWVCNMRGVDRSVDRGATRGVNYLSDKAKGSEEDHHRHLRTGVCKNHMHRGVDSGATRKVNIAVNRGVNEQRCELSRSHRHLCREGCSWFEHRCE